MRPGGGGCELLAAGATADQARQDAAMSESACCQARRATGEPPRDIVYVNGINTNRAAHCMTLKAIAEQTCARVIGIYNATEGAAQDALQTGQDRRLIKAANEGKVPRTQDGRNPAVDALGRFITSEVRSGRKPEIWAHSQGGGGDQSGVV